MIKYELTVPCSLLLFFIIAKVVLYFPSGSINLLSFDQLPRNDFKLQVKESKWLVKCFLNYLRHEKTEVNVLFDILTIFLFHSRIDYTFLKEFYLIEVLCIRVLVSLFLVTLLGLTVCQTVIIFFSFLFFRLQKVIHPTIKRHFCCIF